MPANIPSDFVLRELEPGDRFAGFSLGEAEFQPLKTFLKRDAKRFSEQLLARTYVLADGDLVHAYIALVCGEIDLKLDAADLGGADFRYEHYPALKIARLAVSARLHGMSLGTDLVDFAVGRAVEIAGIAGCRVRGRRRQKALSRFLRKTRVPPDRH